MRARLPSLTLRVRLHLVGAGATCALVVLAAVTALLMTAGKSEQIGAIVQTITGIASTEQTSASTQQIAASAHELAQNAATLEQLVEQFKLTA